MKESKEAIKSQVAIRCAKAAILLYTLKSSRRFNAASISDQYEEEEETKMLMKGEICNLKMELARERLRRKRIELCGLLELILLLVVMLSLSTFLLVLCGFI